jgi:hypothetical protein
MPYYTAIVTLLTVALYFFMATRVAAARGRFNVTHPATTGSLSAITRDCQAAARLGSLQQRRAGTIADCFDEGRVARGTTGISAHVYSSPLRCQYH